MSSPPFLLIGTAMAGQIGLLTCVVSKGVTPGIVLGVISLIVLAIARRIHIFGVVAAKRFRELPAGASG